MGKLNGGKSYAGSRRNLSQRTHQTFGNAERDSAGGGVVTFLDDEVTTANDNQNLAGLGIIIDEDLETASLEIREEFLAAIEKSCADFDK